MSYPYDIDWSGNLSADGYLGGEEGIRVLGGVTVWAGTDLGGGTLTWEFSRNGGTTWKSVYGGAGSTTEQAYTATHQANFYFYGEVLFRGHLSGATSPDLDGEVFGTVGRGAG